MDKNVCVRRKLKLRVAQAYAQTAQCASLLMPLKTLESGRSGKCRSNPGCRSLLRALPCARGGRENLRWVYALADVMWNPHAGLTAQLKSPNTASRTSGMVLHSSLPLWRDQTSPPRILFFYSGLCLFLHDWRVLERVATTMRGRNTTVCDSSFE